MIHGDFKYTGYLHWKKNNANTQELLVKWIHKIILTNNHKTINNSTYQTLIAEKLEPLNFTNYG